MNCSCKFQGIPPSTEDKPKSEGGFVFGQNLEDRAIVSDEQNSDTESQGDKNDEDTNHKSPGSHKLSYRWSNFDLFNGKETS